MNVEDTYFPTTVVRFLKFQKIISIFLKIEQFESIRETYLVIFPSVASRSVHVRTKFGGSTFPESDSPVVSTC